MCGSNRLQVAEWSGMDPNNTDCVFIISLNVINSYTQPVTTVQQ